MVSIFSIKYKVTSSIKITSTISYLATCWRSLWVGPSWVSKRDDFTFPLVNFPFISSNIPAWPADGVHISQFIGYTRDCTQYSDSTKLFAKMLLNQGYVLGEVISTTFVLSSSRSGWLLQNIHISNDNGSFPFYVDFFFPLSRTSISLECVVFLFSVSCTQWCLFLLFSRPVLNSGDCVELLSYYVL